jgi:repressor LexA
MTLTKRQRKILDFVRDFAERRGYAPTLGEIGRHFGLRSPATVHKHLRNLEERGALKRRWNKSRAIEVLPEEGTTRAYHLPLMGTLEGGRPLLIHPGDETVPVPPGLIGERRSFVLRVRGDGFRAELLRDGDLVVIEEVDLPPDGATALVMLPGNEPALGSLSKQGSRVRLQTGNPEPALVDIDKVRVRGRLAGVLRKY